MTQKGNKVNITGAKGFLNKVRHIGAAFVLFSGLAACTAEEGPKEPVESYPIGFVAQTPLTKSGTTRADLKDTFVQNDAIKVYAKRNHSVQVFNAQTVTLGATSWTYDPLKYWNWESSSDSYSFLAVYPASATVNSTDYQGHISERVVYNYTPGTGGGTDQYDLMMAGQRRLGTEANRSSAVPLVFTHMTSAVQIKFRNKSTTKSVTVNSYSFENLSTNATAHAFFNSSESYTLVKHWDDVVSGFSTADDILEHSSLDQTINAYAGTGDLPSYNGSVDLLIPQTLDYTLGETPCPAKLIVNYTPQGGTQKTAEVILKNVQDQHKQIFTTQWEMANRYIYNIDFDLDGGVIVTVITTEWEVIEATTPGIIL